MAFISGKKIVHSKITAINVVLCCWHNQWWGLWKSNDNKTAMKDIQESQQDCETLQHSSISPLLSTKNTLFPLGSQIEHSPKMDELTSYSKDVLFINNILKPLFLHHLFELGHCLYYSFKCTPNNIVLNKITLHTHSLQICEHLLCPQILCLSCRSL